MVQARHHGRTSIMIFVFFLQEALLQDNREQEECASSAGKRLKCESPNRLNQQEEGRKTDKEGKRGTSAWPMLLFGSGHGGCRSW